MEITQLKQMTKEEVLKFIRQRLAFSPEIKKQLKYVKKRISAKNIADSKCRDRKRQQDGARSSILPY